MTDRPSLGRVMMVDDDQVDQMLYHRIIRRHADVEELVSFNYASDALDYLADEGNPRVDVIFLDVNMPRMTGFEFLEAATERLGPHFAGAVVVMLTTSLDPRDRERAARFDVVRAYVNKPLVAEHLLDVTTHLAGPAAPLH